MISFGIAFVTIAYVVLKFNEDSWDLQCCLLFTITLCIIDPLHSVNSLKTIGTWSSVPFSGFTYVRIPCYSPMSGSVFSPGRSEDTLFLLDSSVFCRVGISALFSQGQMTDLKAMQIRQSLETNLNINPFTVSEQSGIYPVIPRSRGSIPLLHIQIENWKTDSSSNKIDILP